MIKGIEIVEAARLEKGTKFIHLGRTSGVGLDCVGLLSLTAQKTGVEHRDLLVYPQYAHPEKLREGLAYCGLLGPLDVSEMKIGDVMFFVWGPKKRLGHVGIYCGDERFIHTYAGGGRVCETGLEDNWRSKLVEVWRFPGVE